MRDHDDQALACDLSEQVHHLDARLRVERAGGLVRQDDLWIVHQGASNGHALHLTAGELRGLLVHMGAKSHALKRGTGAPGSLRAVHARQREGELDVGQNGLVRDEVIALEDEAHAVIAVGIPLSVSIIAGRDTVYYDIARIRVVEPAQDVEKRSLAGARRTQHGHKLVLAKRHGHAVQRALNQVARCVRFSDVANLDHVCSRPYVPARKETPM